MPDPSDLLRARLWRHERDSADRLSAVLTLADGFAALAQAARMYARVFGQPATPLVTPATVHAEACREYGAVFQALADHANPLITPCQEDT